MINTTISAVEQAQLRRDIPEFRVGDTVRVHYKIVEGDKERVQVFQGVVIKRHRAGARSTFTVRKISSNVGVERVFPEHSPRVEKIDILSRGVVRRARLLFLRELSGKAARLKDERDKLYGQKPSPLERPFTRQGSPPMLLRTARRNSASKTRLRGPLDDPMRALRCPEPGYRQILYDLRKPPFPYSRHPFWCCSARVRPPPRPWFFPRSPRDGPRLWSASRRSWGPLPRAWASLGSPHRFYTWRASSRLRASSGWTFRRAPSRLWASTRVWTAPRV